MTKILEANGIDPKEIGLIINGESSEPLFNQLMSSELDADRFDYLLRDSVHTGVAHGRFDVNRLLHTLALDKQGQLCVDKSGMHAAEGYIINRYLMYTVVYTHKTINAFELLIMRIYQDCIGSTLPNFDELMKMITEKEAEFTRFNDIYVFNIIGQKALEAGFTADLCKMYRSREVLQVAREAQGMSKADERKPDFFILNQYSSKKKISALAESAGVPPEWIFHNSPHTSLPHLKPIVEELEEEGEDSQKEISEALRIVNSNKVSCPLVLIDTSIVSYLKNMSLDTVRLYTREKYKDKLKTVLDTEIKEATK
jgi:HD superfamily phosphohydrolase